MSCNDIASILDTHRTARLTPAERAAVDAHLLACTDCAAAWHGHSELLALRVPPVPPTLLERALLASRSPRSAEPRRARMGVIIGTAVLAGAALASIEIMTRTMSPTPPSESVAASAPEAADPAAVDEAREELEATASIAQGDGVTSIELVETALSPQPIVRHPPKYPPSALATRSEGRVQLKFDVTAAGAVENVSVVESNDAQFEDPAIEALRTWRYLPRIAAGKRVRSDGITTIISFVLGAEPQRSDRALDEAAREAQRKYGEYIGAVEVALDRLAADELRGAELQLDEMQALFGSERTDLWNFYGYLYTVQGNYGRAIDAYETAIAIANRSAPPMLGPYAALANLYFARHQYDMALKTVLRPKLLAGNFVMSPEAEALLQKLRALGVTEDALQ